MTQTRRMQVLHAVVEDYIRTQEPVGSAALIARHHLQVSSATIRKDMAALEEEGYLVQPHTSAGRVPTERGYRYFVDTLATVVPLSESQRRAMRTFLDDSVNLQDTLQRAAHLLSELTGQVAVVASPSLGKSRLWHLELVPVSAVSILAVVVTDTGRVAQHVLSVQELPSCEHLQRLAVVINERCSALTLRTAASRIRALRLGGDMDDVRALPGLVAHAFESMADEERTHELFMSGVSTLAHQHATAQDLAPLFDALEERAVLMHLMTALSETTDARGVGVAIGSETNTPGLIHAAVVTSGYGASEADGEDTDDMDAEKDEEGAAVAPIAFVGSIGPTHMNYAVTMASVRAVARYLTTFLGRTGTTETSMAS